MVGGQKQRQNIAIIGGGISGLSAAYALADRYSVTIFEAAPHLGGHARTVLAGKNGDQPVDTGFIVFNRPNYPRMVPLFEELGVPIKNSDMSFGAAIDNGEIEYGLRDLKALISDKRNLMRPGFYRMVRDILYFNKHVKKAAAGSSLSIGELAHEMGLGSWFRDYYLSPLAGAIWSTPTEKIGDFPAQAFVSFFENHALLQSSDQHQWLTVDGGSVEYVRRFEAALRKKDVEIQASTPVGNVERMDKGIKIRAGNQTDRRFDHVVFACHSDDALQLIGDPSGDETRMLGAMTYQDNDVILHADLSIMPKRRGAWASWNFRDDRADPTAPIAITYWMNLLQSIPESDPLFVSLNCREIIDPSLIYDTVTLRHPVFDQAALDAQNAMKNIQGLNNTWFAGAYLKNGFHEDGCASGFAVAEAILAGSKNG